MRSTLIVALAVVLALGIVRAHDDARHLIEEVGAAANSYVTTYCDPKVAGPNCFDPAIPAWGHRDFPPGSPEITYPTDGTPWGVHLTGPYPDGKSYLVSWFSGAPTTGSGNLIKQPVTNTMVAMARTATCMTCQFTTYSGKIVTYKRDLLGDMKNYSYVSPLISHVVLQCAKPGQMVYYQLYLQSNKTWSKMYSFKSVPSGYPLRIGLMGDVGQTVNSSHTRDHIMANKPDTVLFGGDYSYADDYDADNMTVPLKGKGTNQNRWDTFAQLWERFTCQVPWMATTGNHELEISGINWSMGWNVSNYSYPENYPFQTYAARYPTPGTTSDFGNMNKNLYYSTIIGGKVKVISMNNYVGFYPGSAQHKWAMDEFASINRKNTPWVIVMFHTSPYHTYSNHFKEGECFMSVWEDVFYRYGVDLVVGGHVHAYERTHPVYKYKKDTCGPMYITVGDGGTVGGVNQNFADEVDPVTKKPYCDSFERKGLTPLELLTKNPDGWGPAYQLDANAPKCPTLSWQTPYSVKNGPMLMRLNSSSPLGFCQSSQPLHSAHRDPSFGHAMLIITDDRTAKFAWYKNMGQKAEAVDTVTLKRKVCSYYRRRRAMERAARRAARRVASLL